MGWEKLPNGKQYTINIILVICNKYMTSIFFTVIIIIPFPN